MDFNKYLKMQEHSFDQALLEIQSGKKETHWIWWIFPQYRGLGSTITCKFYAIQNLDETKEYLSHPVLGLRLRQITQALLLQPETNAHNIFGSPDDMKVKSCMTLFSQVDSSEESLFREALDKFYNGMPDEKTLRLLEE